MGLYLLSSLIIISLVTASLAYIIIKLNKADKKLRKENGTDLNLSFTIPKDTILDATTEKKLRKEGKIIKKRKLGWVYAPDRAEEWLEKMETSGYNLYRMSRMGNSFYFIKGEPRTVRYCMDFQNIVNKSYFEIHKSNGWKLLFTSLSSLTKYTVWSKEYSDVRSELYSDKSNILKHAKNQCRLYLILFIPLIILYLLMIGGFIIMYLELKHIVIAIDVAIFSVCIVEYGYFVMTSLRVKKRIS